MTQRDFFKRASDPRAPWGADDDAELALRLREEQEIDGARECTVCTPQVIRCAHFAGVSIMLADSKRLACAAHGGFDVVRATGPLVHIPWACCDGVSLDPRSTELLIWTFDKAAAIAAFEEAARGLLSASNDLAEIEQ